MARPNFDFGTFFVDEVILHKIPKVARGQKDTVAPELAAAPSNLDDRRRNFFRDRITTSLKTRSLSIVHDADAASPVPQLVVDYFKTNGANFVDASRQMAEHLYKVQSGISPEGALAVIAGTMGSGKSQGKCLAVLKLEMDAAMLLEPDKTADGKDTFNIRLEQVTLNERAQVFKASLFGRADTLSKLDGRASDIQASNDLWGADIADFFLQAFLGCRRRDPADRATLEFKEKTEAAITAFVEDDALKWQLEKALMTELASNETEIDPKEWVKKNVPTPDLQDAFLAPFVDEDGSVPIIKKEKTLVADALRRRVIFFDNGLRLEGPAEAVEESVDVAKGSTTITSGVKEVKAKR